MTGKLHSTGTKWWPLLGYSQAVTHGSLVHVSATAVAEVRNKAIGRDDPYAQTEQALRNLLLALAALGAGPENVIRTRVHVADIVHWPAIARAYAAVFAEFSPENRAIGPRLFRCPEALVEIEADALVLHGRHRRPGGVAPRLSTCARGSD